MAKVKARESKAWGRPRQTSSLLKRVGSSQHEPQEMPTAWKGALWSESKWVVWGRWFLPVLLTMPPRIMPFRVLTPASHP